MRVIEPRRFLVLLSVVVMLSMTTAARAATCPAGYSYTNQIADFAGTSYEATVTMNAAPTIVATGDHTNSYVSVDHRLPDGHVDYWIQAGITRGGAGGSGSSIPDRGFPILYAEKLTASGYQIIDLGPATVGAAYTFRFTGSGSTWTAWVGGAAVMTSDLGAAVNDRGTAAEVYRGDTSGVCPEFDWTFGGDVLGRWSSAIVTALPLELVPGGYRARLPVPASPSPPPAPPEPPIPAPPTPLPPVTPTAVVSLTPALLSLLRAEASAGGQISGEAKNEPPFVVSAL